MGTSLERDVDKLHQRMKTIHPDLLEEAAKALQIPLFDSGKIDFRGRLRASNELVTLGEVTNPREYGPVQYRLGSLKKKAYHAVSDGIVYFPISELARIEKTIIFETNNSMHLDTIAEEFGLSYDIMRRLDGAAVKIFKKKHVRELGHYVKSHDFTILYKVLIREKLGADPGEISKDRWHLYQRNGISFLDFAGNSSGAPAYRKSKKAKIGMCEYFEKLGEGHYCCIVLRLDKRYAFLYVPYSKERERINASFVEVFKAHVNSGNKGAEAYHYKSDDQDYAGILLTKKFENLSRLIDSYRIRVLFSNDRSYGEELPGSGLELARDAVEHALRDQKSKTAFRHMDKKSPIMRLVKEVYASAGIIR